MKTPKSGVTFAVSHHIHLNHEQRYALFNGEVVKVQGTSVPVWYFKGRTSEPGNEVFCDYTLFDDPENNIDINQEKTGYIINISSKQKDKLKYDHPTAESLKDIKDGGSASMMFNQYSRSNIKGILIHVLHFVHIGNIEELKNSLIEK